MASRDIGVRACSMSFSATVSPASGVLRQVHIGHAAAAQLLADHVLADFAAGRRDHFWRAPACGASIQTCCAGRTASGVWTLGRQFQRSFRRRCPPAPAARLARRQPAPLLRWMAIVRNPRGGGPEIRMPSRQAIVDRVADASRAAAPADLDPDARASNVRCRRLPLPNYRARFLPKAEWRRRPGSRKPLKRALVHAVRHTRAVAHGAARRTRLAGHAAAQSHAVFQLHLLAILAGQHLDGVARAGLPPWRRRSTSERRARARPSTRRGV